MSANKTVIAAFAAFAVCLLGVGPIPLAARPASAQAPAAAPVASEPMAPSAPPLVYHSPFAGYRAFDEVTVSDWRGANALVERIGGWRAYAREAQQASPAGAGSADPTAAAARGAPAASPGDEARRAGSAK